MSNAQTPRPKRVEITAGTKKSQQAILAFSGEIDHTFTAKTENKLGFVFQNLAELKCPKFISVYLLV